MTCLQLAELSYQESRALVSISRKICREQVHTATLKPGAHTCRLRCGLSVYQPGRFGPGGLLKLPISQITNSQRALQSEHVRHPWPLTSHRIRRNSQEIEKKLSEGWGVEVKNPSGENRGVSLSRMDRCNRCHVTRWTIDVMWPEGIITELQHIQWVWQSVWRDSSEL